MSDPVLANRDELLDALSEIADGGYLPCTERVPVDPLSPGPTASGTRSVDGEEEA